MPVVPILTGIAAVATVVGTAASISAQRKAAKEAKRANKFERQKSDLQSARQKMEALREGRIAYSNAQQAAANQGATGTSIEQGGSGAIMSKTMSNLSFLDQYGFYSDQASKHLQKSADANANANLWGSVANLGAKVYAETGGFQFKGPKPPAAQG